MKTMDNFELFENYLEGRLSPEQIKDFEQMLANNPSMRNEFETFRIASESIRLHSRTELKTMLNKIHQSVFGPVRLLRSGWTYAALAVIGGLIIFALNNTGSENENDSLTKTNISVHDAGTNANTTAKNEENQIAEFTEINSSPQQVGSGEIKIDFSKISGNGPAYVSVNPNQAPVMTPPVITNPASINPKDVTTPRRDAGDIPLVRFFVNVRSGCAPVTVKFTDSSTVKNGNIISRLWEFGDGATSTLANPTHIFAKNGIYSVKLTVTTDLGFSQSATYENFIISNIVPEADFQAVPSVVLLSNASIKFNNQTRYATPNIKWAWTFGDGSAPSTISSPVHKYSDTGIFKVRLTALNEYGCSSYKDKNIEVLKEVNVFIPNAFIVDGVNPLFKVSCEGIKQFSMLIFNSRGELLYESNDYATHGWGGKSYIYTEREEPAGVYVCKLKVMGLDDNPYQFTQTFTLIR